MFIRKQVTKFIQIALGMSIFCGSAIRSTAFALDGSKERSLKLGHLGLRVIIDRSFEHRQPSARRWKAEICNNFFTNLKIDRGPWGFGLFNSVVGCDISQQGSEPFMDPLVWTLNISLNEQSQGVVALCRPYAGDTEKCEASVTIPTSRYLPELLNNNSYARLVAAALLDQMPFRSKLTSQLLGADTSIAPKDETARESEFPLPPLSSEIALHPVSAEILIPQAKFRVELKKESLAQLLSQPNIWLVSNVRGSMGKTFSTLISDATATLGARFLELAALDAKSHTILGRNARRKSKAGRLFKDRIESVVETRLGGTFKNSKDSAMTADVELLLTESVFKNLWLSVNSLVGNYRYKVNTNFKVLEPSTDRSATRTLMIAMIGTGVRWSSQMDHTLFFYPRLEFGRVTWKADRISDDPQSLETDTIFIGKPAPATGLSLGYQSPERWPVQWQARFGVIGLNQDQHRSITADVAAYANSPIVNFAQRTEIFGFASYQSTKIAFSANVSSLVKNSSIQVSDIVFGGGFRLLWL